MSELDPNTVSRIVDCERTYITNLVQAIAKYGEEGSLDMYIEAVHDLCVSCFHEGATVAEAFHFGVYQPLLDSDELRLTPSSSIRSTNEFLNGMLVGARAAAAFYRGQGEK